MIKFLPSFVGSKSHWVSRLQDYNGYDFIELFAGSAVLSANLARHAILNDSDIYLYKYYSSYQDLPIIDVFTKDNYFDYRSRSDWYMFLYYLQKMSFSGVYRWSKNGYNVPIKKDNNVIMISDNLKHAKNRFKILNPKLYCLPYNEVDLPDLSKWVIILDPPYEHSKADYNKQSFDYHVYWEFVGKIIKKAKSIILFDTCSNMPFNKIQTRKMVVNGKYGGNIESMFIFDKQKKDGELGEIIIAEKFKDRLIRIDGLCDDFISSKNNEKIELKTDYYDMNKTCNFFIERWGDYTNRLNGGPWQAIEHKCKYYMYFFKKNGIYYIFDTERLVKRLDNIISTLHLIFVMNSKWKTAGYKIDRSLLTDLVLYKGDINE